MLLRTVSSTVTTLLTDKTILCLQEHNANLNNRHIPIKRWKIGNKTYLSTLFCIVSQNTTNIAWLLPLCHWTIHSSMTFLATIETRSPTTVWWIKIPRTPLIEQKHRVIWYTRLPLLIDSSIFKMLFHIKHFNSQATFAEPYCRLTELHLLPQTHDSQYLWWSPPSHVHWL